MSEGDISQISVGEFETVSQLLASSESLQLAFMIMVIGIIIIAAAYRTFSSLVKSKKIFYTRPHLSKFVQNAVLPFFAIALISSTNAYIQTSELFEQDSNLSVLYAIDGAEAIAQVEENHPDLVLTDMRMPNLDGLQLVREVDAHGLLLFHHRPGRDDTELDSLQRRYQDEAGGKFDVLASKEGLEISL